MDELRCTLVAEGNTDEALIPILRWLLQQAGVALPVDLANPDYRQFKQGPTLNFKIEVALKLNPCQLLFVHRDADNTTIPRRREEIMTALHQHQHPPAAVCVIPVKSFEAWVMFDEPAIRKAAGNPNGKVKLDLPDMKRIEEMSPKTTKDLFDQLIKTASGKKGRDLAKLHPRQVMRDLTAYIDDFSPLRNLSAFRILETDLQQIISEQGWNRL